MLIRVLGDIGEAKARAAKSIEGTGRTRLKPIAPEAVVGGRELVVKVQLRYRREARERRMAKQRRYESVDLFGIVHPNLVGWRQWARPFL